MRIGKLFVILFFSVMLCGCDAQVATWSKVEGAWKSRENNPLSGKPYTYTFSEKTATYEDDEIRNVTYAESGDGIITVSLVGGNSRWCVIALGTEKDTLAMIEYGDKHVFIKTTPQEIEHIRKMQIKDRRHEPL
ncbi:MAG: hypothetical protein Q4G66_13250 [bacterium]|nr:hypothetical protein [bacterium]